MALQIISLAGRATLGVLLTMAAACSSTPPPSPQLLARCNAEYALWARYYSTFPGPTWEKLYADLARYRCHTGRYQEGMEVLQKILVLGKLKIPK